MKTYSPSRRNTKVPARMRVPFHYKDKKSNLKDNGGSTYFKIKIAKPQDEESEKVKYVPGVGMILVRPKYAHFIVELDSHQNAEPHFHIWRADGNSKVSDTRSKGISLRSSVNSGIEYTTKERNREPKLNSIQEVEIQNFILENKFLLFLMYHAHKHGKVKEFYGLDEAYVSSLYSDAELKALIQKFMLMYKEDPSLEFGK